MKLILSQIILKITFSNKFMIPLRVKEYIQKKTSLESRPFILNIEVTSVCNLDCPICPSKDTIKKGFIEINLIKKIVEGAKYMKYIIAEKIEDENLAKIFFKLT